MTKYGKFILLLYISIAIAVVCIIVFHFAEQYECSSTAVPSYDIASKDIKKYRLTNPQSRASLESIAEYALQDPVFTGAGFTSATLTDYALHTIATSPIDALDVKRIRVFNDAGYVDAITAYDTEAGEFKTDELRTLAISVAKKYYDNPSSADVTTQFANYKDSQIYDALVRPTATAAPKQDTTPPVVSADVGCAATTSEVFETSTDNGVVRTLYKDGTRHMLYPTGQLVVTDSTGKITSKCSTSPK